MLRQNRTNIIIFYIITAAALTAAAFIDLQLDIKLNSPENPFAIWFQNTGEIPCRLICPLAGTVRFTPAKADSEKPQDFLSQSAAPYISVTTSANTSLLKKTEWPLASYGA